MEKDTTWESLPITDNQRALLEKIGVRDSRAFLSMLAVPDMKEIVARELKVTCDDIDKLLDIARSAFTTRELGEIESYESVDEKLGALIEDNEDVDIDKVKGGE